MKRFFYKKLRDSARGARIERSGMTLIEVLVASVVTCIIMGAVLSVFLLMNSSYLSSTRKATAQNLAVQTMQKIQSTVRYKTTVAILHTDPAATSDGIYYSSSDDGIRMGSATYLKGAYKGYFCYLNFRNIDPSKKLLSIDIKITYKGTQIFDTTGSVYLLCIKNFSGDNQNALTFS